MSVESESSGEPEPLLATVEEAHVTAAAGPKATGLDPESEHEVRCIVLSDVC